jgi:hypothetical protein
MVLLDLLLPTVDVTAAMDRRIRQPIQPGSVIAKKVRQSPAMPDILAGEESCEASAWNIGP